MKQSFKLGQRIYIKIPEGPHNADQRAHLHGRHGAIAGAAKMLDAPYYPVLLDRRKGEKRSSVEQIRADYLREDQA